MEKHRRDMTKPLDRYLSPLDVWAMAFGCMVGWGVFAMPGKDNRHVHNNSDDGVYIHDTNKCCFRT